MARSEHDPDRHAFALALAAGLSSEAAGDAVGISRSTAYRWRSDPAVQATIEAARQSIERSVTGRMSDLLSETMGRAMDIAKDKNTPPSVIVRLLAVLLSESRQWAETGEILQRIAQIEEHLSPATTAAELRKAITNEP